MNKTTNILDFLEFHRATAEQEEALMAMAAFVDQSCLEDFLILSGAAGTGKTSITTALIRYLNSKKIPFHVGAPTGRAARILGKKAKTASTTIHSLIYSIEADAGSGEVVFRLKANQEEKYTVYILDEASMISSIADPEPGSLFISTNSLLNDLVRFVKRGNPKNKLILLGDRNQLPPVRETTSKALSAEYLEKTYRLTGKAYQLTEVKRQQQDSYILKNAVVLREAMETHLSPVELCDIKRQSLWLAAMNYVEEYKANGFESSISIAATHNMNRVFNNLAREFLFGEEAGMVVSGDLLLINQTWRRKRYELYSGDHVIVEEVDLDDTEYIADLSFVPVTLRYKNLHNKEEILKDFLLLECIDQPKGLKANQERKLRFERFRANKTYQKSGMPADDKYVGAIRATYGYSITCHKAQGGEWKKVYLNDFFIPSLEYHYTAITRAREELVFY